MECFWEDDAKHYPGCVSAVHESEGTVNVDYDDGEIEIDLELDENIRMQDEGNNVQGEWPPWIPPTRSTIIISLDSFICIRALNAGPTTPLVPCD